MTSQLTQDFTAFSMTLNHTASSLLTQPQTQATLIREVLRITYAIAMGIVMMGMGCGADVEKLEEHLKKPVGIIVGAISQFVFMPTIAFALAKIFQMPDLHTLALLLVGSCPGGSSSNIVTYWINGDMSLSLAMTTFSSILGFGMMPLLLWIYSFGFSSSLVVPFQTIGITLASLVGPIIVGILIRFKFPKVANVILKVTAVLGVIFVIAAVVLSFVTYNGHFALTTMQIVCAAILSGTGMLLGYAFSSVVSLYKPFYFHHYQRRTISLETGVQNNSLASTIIQLSGFTLVEVGQIVLFPLINFVGQVFWVLVMMSMFKLHQCWRKSHPSSEDTITDQPTINNQNQSNPVKATINLAFVEDEFSQCASMSNKDLNEKTRL